MLLFCCQSLHFTDCQFPINRVQRRAAGGWDGLNNAVVGIIFLISVHLSAASVRAASGVQTFLPLPVAQVYSSPSISSSANNQLQKVINIMHTSYKWYSSTAGGYVMFSPSYVYSRVAGCVHNCLAYCSHGFLRMQHNQLQQSVTASSHSPHQLSVYRGVYTLP